MKIDKELVEKLEEKNYSLKRTRKSEEIFEKAKIIDPESLDYWEEFEHTQGMLDIDNFVAYVLETGSSIPAGVIVTGLEEEGRLWIEIFAVSTEARKKGLSRLLVDLARNIGRHQSARIIMVDTEDEEEIHMFESLGFNPLGNIANYYPDSTKTTIMGSII